MKHKRWVIGSFGALGLAVAAGYYAYWLYTFPDGSLLLSLLINPPSWLLIAFIDFEVSQQQLLIVWVVIGLLNAGLYATVAALVIELLSIIRKRLFH